MEFNIYNLNKLAREALTAKIPDEVKELIVEAAKEGRFSVNIPEEFVDCLCALEGLGFRRGSYNWNDVNWEKEHLSTMSAQPIEARDTEDSFGATDAAVASVVVNSFLEDD